MHYTKRVIYCAIALLLLLIGLSIYYFFRTPILAFTLFCIAPYEHIAINTNNTFYYFLVYCLPDALWYISLLLVQTLFLREKGWLNYMLVGIAISLPFLLETSQYYGLVTGTFDWYDILTYCFTLILFLCLRKLFLHLHYKS